MELSDAVALITGGTRMGATLGRALAAQGAHVAFAYARSAEAAHAAADVVRAAGRHATTFQADLEQPTACARLVGDTVAWRQRLDVLICLASVFDRVPLGDLTPEEWGRQLSIDLDASFHCARTASAHMRTRGVGHIILCSDWVAASGRPRYTGYVPYYVAKAGVIALAEALALELADTGVQVNAIAPGPMLPAAGATPEMQQAVMDATPLARWGGAEGLTQAVIGLLSQDWMTGQTVRVDGGRHLAI